MEPLSELIRATSAITSAINVTNFNEAYPAKKFNSINPIVGILYSNGFGQKGVIGGLKRRDPELFARLLEEAKKGSDIAEKIIQYSHTMEMMPALDKGDETYNDFKVYVAQLVAGSYSSNNRQESKSCIDCYT